MPISAPSGERTAHRPHPPALNSPSQTESEKPCGPNHRLRSSHFVNASKTIDRGASKMRTIRVSRSLGVVALSVPVLRMENVGEGEWKESVERLLFLPCASSRRRRFLLFLV